MSISAAVGNAYYNVATNANAVIFSPYTNGLPLASTRVGVANANYTIGANEYIIGYTSLTATRTATLPATSAIGRRIIVKDESGSSSPSVKITISGAIDGATSLDIVSAYGWAELYFNGTAWARIA